MSIFGRRPDPEAVATQLIEGLESGDLTLDDPRWDMVSIFHGDDEHTHSQFQAWRKANPDGFHMTESRAGEFTVHYAQDKRENLEGRGCMHQGVSDNEYGDDKGHCYTTARKVCSTDLAALLAWAAANGFKTKPCKNCDTTRFPFPT